MTTVVSMAGAPGCGKSTLAYGLMHLLKSRGHRAEYVPEYAKELVYRKDFVTLGNQFEVCREQDRRLRDLLGQVDWIINDSALPLGIVYAKPPYDEPWFARRMWELYDGYQNFLIFVERSKPYENYGRKETENEARALDDRIHNLFGPERINLTLEGREGNEEAAYRAIMALKPE